MGKHSKGRPPIPAETTQAASDWNAMAPEQKADSFDAQYADSQRNAEAHPDPWRRPQPGKHRKVS